MIDSIKSEIHQKQKAPEFYSKVRLLGTGTFGKAFLVEGEKTGDLYVAKEIDISQMNEEEKKEVFKEAKIMEGLNHPNIVKFKEVYKTKRGALCMIMEYADGGDILEKINEAHGNYFPEIQILNWFTQIALALKHCHDRKILHRDLKSQNIFLTAKSYVKLGDFGISKILERTSDKALTIVGTPYYLSPEIIQKKPYSFDADIWSLGVLLYEICCLRPPFDSDSLSGLGLKIISGKYNPLPRQYSRNLRELVREMLSIDPKARPNINQILRKPFVHNQIKMFLSQAIYNREFAHTILHGKVFGKSTTDNSSPINISRYKVLTTTDAESTLISPNTKKVVKLKKTVEASALESQRLIAPNQIELPKLREHNESRRMHTPSPGSVNQNISGELNESRSIRRSSATRKRNIILCSKKSEEKKKITLTPINLSRSRSSKKEPNKRMQENIINKKQDIATNQKIKRGIIKAINNNEKKKVIEAMTRNRIELEKLYSEPIYSSGYKDKNPIRKRRIIKTGAVNNSVAIDRSEKDMEKVANQLSSNIIENTALNRKKMNDCDKDIARMISEMQEVFFFSSL